MSALKKRQRKKASVQKLPTIKKVKPAPVEEPDPFDDWLLDDEEPTMATTNHKTSTWDEEEKAAPKVTPTGTKENPDIQPAQAQRNALEPVDKSDTRSFQTGVGPDGREMLTKEEARAKGFHWLDTEEDVAKAKSKKKDD